MDNSGLYIKRMGEKQFGLAVLGPLENFHQDRAYLRRHRLLQRRFPSRAHPVDAVRLALQSEPRSAGPQTQWVKQREGEYLSRDGYWLLQRQGPVDVLFSPHNQLARERVSTSSFLCRGRWSLRACAFYADDLNLRMLLLPRP